MSNPRYGWWGYAKYMARNYPVLKAQASTAKDEDTVLHILGEHRKREYDAVTAALEVAANTPGNGHLRRQLADMMYIKRSHTLVGAAEKLHISYGTAKNYNRDFLYNIAKYYGIM